VIARDVLKFFLGHAPLLLVAFSRWRIERLFEDDKEEIGW